MPVLVFSITIVFMGGIVAWAVWYQKRQLETSWHYFEKLGQAFQIQVDIPKLSMFNASMPMLRGTYKGHSINVHTERRRSGKHTYHYTIVTLFASGTNHFNFRLLKEGFFQKVGKMFGGQDINTGDDIFDKQFVLKSNQPDLALQIFDRMLCAKITDEYPSINSSLDLNNGALVYNEQIMLTSEKSLERYINVIHLCIAIIEKVSGKTGSRSSGRG